MGAIINSLSLLFLIVLIFDVFFGVWTFHHYRWPGKPLFIPGLSPNRRTENGEG